MVILAFRQLFTDSKLKKNMEYIPILLTPIVYLLSLLNLTLISFQMELQEHTAKLEIQNLEAKYREKLTHLEQENFKLKRLSKGVYL